MYRFDHLPIAVLEKILSFLNLADRIHLAQTCHTLHDVFHSPSLWNKAKFVISTSTSKKVLSKYMDLTKEFGKYLKHLTLDYCVNAYSTSVETFLLTLSQKSPSIESLTLHIRVSYSKSGHPLPRQEPLNWYKLNCEMILGFVDSMPSLKKLNVLSWPTRNNVPFPNIVHLLQRSKTSGTIEFLNLFWVNPNSAILSTRNDAYLDTHEYVNTINKFQNLSKLKIVSPMLSTDLLLNLAKGQRNQLQSLSILVMCKRQTVSIPDILPEAWIALRENSPCIQIEVAISTCIPSDELNNLFRPALPLSDITFMKHSQCTAIDMQLITDNYSKTLKKFVDFSDSCGLDEIILDMVQTCSKLNYLDYRGKLHYSTVTHLAKLRGTQWYYFQICSQNVVTVDNTEADDCDTVISKNEDGSFRIAGPYNQITLERKAVLEVMIHEVSEYIAQRWLPFDMMEACVQNPY